MKYEIGDNVFWDTQKSYLNQDNDCVDLIESKKEDEPSYYEEESETRKNDSGNMVTIKRPLKVVWSWLYGGFRYSYKEVYNYLFEKDNKNFLTHNLDRDVKKENID